MSLIDSVAALEACYPELASAPAANAEVGWLTPHYRALVEAAPFAILVSSGPGGLDGSPRGGPPGFIRVVDDSTLVLPERRGGDRLDSLRNILANPEVALLFLIPNSSTTLRVGGRAVISADPDLLARFGPRDAPPAALIITVESACFQSSRAVLKSGLWSPVTWGNPDHLPSPAEMLEVFDPPENRGRLSRRA